MIYLDHNATSPVLPAVAEEITRCLQAGYANPSSQHTAGRRARRRLEDAREEIAAILGAESQISSPDRVIFTSGGTEANNLAVLGLAPNRAGQVLVSAVEHPSILAAAQHLQRQGHPVERLPVDSEGRVDVAALQHALARPTRLVSIMLGNHETGVLQPVEAVAALCRQAGVPLHCDAVQGVGKIPVNFVELGVDALTCSAHKLGGPVGIGVLLVRGGVDLQPLLFGGAQQFGQRPGTEPIALIAGFCEALRQWQLDTNRAERLRQLRDQFEAHLRTALPRVVINGSGALRLPHTSNIAFPGVDRQRLLMALDLAGVACSTGSACASGSTDPSPVLTAMGVPPEQIQGALRFSLGATTTAEEIDQAASKIASVASGFWASSAPAKQGSTARDEARSPV